MTMLSRILRAAFLLGALVSLTAYAATDPSLVAHYTFDEGAGEIAVDHSGKGHDGRITGASFVPSPRGHALLFDGPDEVVDFGSAPSMAVEGDLTLMIWVLTDARIAPRTHRLLFGDTNGSVNRNLNLRIDHSNQLRYEWGDGTDYDALLTDSDMLDGTWRQLTIVCDGQAGYVMLYVDGTPFAQRRTEVEVSRTGFGRRMSGAWSWGLFSGRIDEIRLYSRALSEGEITGLVSGANAAESAAQSPGSVTVSAAFPAQRSVTPGDGIVVGEPFVALDPGGAGMEGIQCLELTNLSAQVRRARVRIFAKTRDCIGDLDADVPGGSAVCFRTDRVPLEMLSGGGCPLYVPGAPTSSRRVVVSFPGSADLRSKVLTLAPSSWCEPLRVQVDDSWQRQGADQQSNSMAVHVRAGIQADLFRRGRLRVAVAPRSGGAPVWHTVIDQPDRVLSVVVPGKGLAWDAYRVEAVWEGAGGTERAAAWGVGMLFPGGPHRLRVLNNLVTELAHARGDQLREPGGVPFMNPRDGWCWFRLSGAGVARLDDEADALMRGSPAGRAVEAMRKLPAGRHRLELEGDVVELTVRAIPALIYNFHQASTRIAPFGPHTWERVTETMLPQCTTVEGSGSDYPVAMQEVRDAGKLWVSWIQTPGLFERGGRDVTVDDAMSCWRRTQGYTHPLAGGIQADEFISGYSEASYIAFARSMAMLSRDPAFAGRTFIPFVVRTYDLPGGMLFMKAVMAAGWPFSIERYVPEGATEADGRRNIESGLVRRCEDWERAIPGSMRHAIVTLMYAVLPYCTANACPTADFKVHLDLQMQTLATHPLFFGLYGVQPYRSNYADLETLRWMGRLLRHYAIEGRTDRLSTDPYELELIRNPDFAEGLEHWTATAAEGDSLSVVAVPELGTTQGRYPPSARGDTALIMRRSTVRPNVVRQPIRGLTPGRAYSVKMIAADHRDYVARTSRREDHAVSLRVEDAEVLPGAFSSAYCNVRGPREFGKDNRFWMTYHWLTFRATGDSALLVISDWLDGTTAGGPDGQEIMVNDLEVQPFLE